MRKNTAKFLTAALVMSMGLAMLTACGKDTADGADEGQAVDIAELEDTEKETAEATEAETEAATEEATEAAKEESSYTDDMDFTGSWQDEVSLRAMMDMVRNEDGSYYINVHWGGSAFEYANWEITGTFDSTGTLTYDNCKYSVVTGDEDGAETVSDEQTTTGSLKLEGEKLRWTDSLNSEDGLFVMMPDEGGDVEEIEAPEDEDYISVLPDYVYKGSDGIISAITQYMIVQYKSNYAACDVSIPCPIIVDKDETDVNDIKVWGNFWLYNYMQNDDTLMCESGGAYPGCMHLKQTDSGYEVISFDLVADGSDYTESAKEIFGDKYDAFVEKEADEAGNASVRAEFISDYVKAHDLAITKYQDSGWDPVSLP